MLDVNRGACALHGMTREQLMGVQRGSNSSFRPGAARPPARNFKRLASGQISWVESESLRADGRDRAGGNPRGARGI